MVNTRMIEGLFPAEASLGLDVDWEYPKDGPEAQNLVELLRETRAVSRVVPL